MKILFILTFLFSLSLTGSAFALDLAIGSKGNIIVDFPDGMSLKLYNVLVSSENPADLNFDFGDLNKDHRIVARFHNGTEASWFMQFIKQLDGDLYVKYTDELRKPAVPVEKYFMTLKKQNQPITITWTPADKVHSTCDKTATSDVVNLVSEKPEVDLDVFIDIFRFQMEDHGFWVGVEGERDLKEKTDQRQLPVCLMNSPSAR